MALNTAIRYLKKGEWQKAHELALAKPVINPVRKGANLLATSGLIVVANYS